MSDILDTIRRAIESDGRTRYRLSKDSGIAQAVLSRFMSGERGLSIDLVERLADVLDLEIAIRPKGRKSGKR